MKKRTGITAAATLLLLSTVIAGTVVVHAREPELISVDSPALSENGEIELQDCFYIPVDISSLEITEEEVDAEIDMLLYDAAQKDPDSGTPELNDEFVQTYSAAYLGRPLDSVAELKEYMRDQIYHGKLQGQILESLRSKALIDSYKKETFDYVREYARQGLARGAQVQLYTNINPADEEEIAQQLGYASAEDYLDAQAMFYAKDVMILDELAELLNITCSEEDVQTAILDLMSYYGYSDETSVETYIEENGGDPWLFMVEKLNVEYDRVLKAMEQYAVVEETDGQGELSEQKQKETENAYGFTNLTQFSARTLDHTAVTEKLFADKDLTILIVWGTWDGYCIEAMPGFAEYAATLPENMQMVTYCVDGAKEQDLMSKIAEESGLTEQGVITMYSGEDDLTKLDEEVIYLPMTFFLNNRGEQAADPIVGIPEDFRADLDGHAAQAVGIAE